MLENIHIILVNPSHSGNIGAAARAMKTMGFSKMCLVGPRKFPDQDALTRASGADDILQNARVVDSLEEALAPCHSAYACSARSRHLPWPLMPPRDAALQIQQFHQQHDDNNQVAMVFGRERSGLNNEELSLCHYHIQIPTVADFSSLNLSQAIQVLCYELRMTYLSTAAPGFNPQANDDEPLANGEEVEGFYQHLESTLTEIEFLNPKQPRMLMQRLRRLFNRAHLHHTEIHILRGILSAVKRKSSSGNIE